ncbi:2-polyprenyl-3-methyl-6-methoxy-1,4-benzoquinone monooxygenase [Polynucleobacter sp. HIN10]|nr:2-polyprenyl-3-methyl-6-methoxy-1,4-benzoquinone monooxygenase [Polynucleobacter sp. HIN6]BEI40216.1 2-polyprenyl-3-methyl-6-methoxy-1,4-benzoquinone monooxygenase [Polynucleobacter sp. HIN9]BEI41998.1 2-polyprenyl-3-methyl-6-methoxy-1,4-benzoquinone monooxygenase [Polynucleobacter sp. HIN10]BEI43775.1 2-polyprenyl-3-methyl-6-methoxy-1,4-benzoquinone monooxygenase [Polynucleobacter sp. HIN11]
MSRSNPINLSPIDHLIGEFDTALRAIAGGANYSRPVPKANIQEGLNEEQVLTSDLDLSPKDRTHVAGLMRVNHVGEVCAQALYQSQKLLAKTPETRALLDQAAKEEMDHMAWCEERLKELDSRPSLLNPLWYAGAFGIGLVAGLAGDRWSLGFVAETEKQVERHLNDHLEKLPEADLRSRAIVEQMRIDEIEHGASAIAAGGQELPQPIQTLMAGISKIMTTTAYKI